MLTTSKQFKKKDIKQSIKNVQTSMQPAQKRKQTKDKITRDISE